MTNSTLVFILLLSPLSAEPAIRRMTRNAFQVVVVQSAPKTSNVCSLEGSSVALVTELEHFATHSVVEVSKSLGLNAI